MRGAGAGRARVVARRARAAAGAMLACAMLAGGVPAHAQTGTQEGTQTGTQTGIRWQGWVQAGGAYTFARPAHLSQARLRGELAGLGTLGNGVKWKVSARLVHDAAYALTDFYPPEVRHNQRSELALREAYVDFSRGDWEFRIGKQNIVWGEMVGLFFADVVSAKDMREFILPEFEQIRIPQWAARAEWFRGDTHLEFIWLPAPATDLIGKPGADFYPYPPELQGYGYQIDGEARPSRRFSNGGFGIRASTLVKGWDLSAFAYRSPDNVPTFYRTILDVPVPTVVYQPRFDRTNRLGGTLGKDFDGVVVKGELIYTDGRSFASSRSDVDYGLLPLRTLDWIVGADLTPADGWRVNTQLFQRIFVEYDASIGLRRHETGASLLLSYEVANGVDVELLAISSLVRRDWMLRPAMVWKPGASSRVRLGVDLFGGERFGLFGRYADRDRAYVEYRLNF